MKAKELKGKLIYQPKGPAGEYAQWAVNLHNGCTHGCTYCYNRRGVLSHAFGDKPKLAAPISKYVKKTNQDRIRAGLATPGEDAAAILREFQLTAVHNIIKDDIAKIGKERLIADGGVFMSFKCDPLEASNRRLSEEAFEVLGLAGIPVTLLTKSADWLDTYAWSLYTLFPPFKNLLTIGITLTGHDEMEPNAPSNHERIALLKSLKERDIKTFVSLEPVISFEASLNMIEQAAHYCKEFRIGLMSPYKKTRYCVFDLVDFIDKVNTLQAALQLDIHWKTSVFKELQKKGIAYTLAHGVLDIPQAERVRLDLLRSTLDAMYFGDVTGDQSDFDGIFGCMKKE